MRWLLLALGFAIAAPAHADVPDPTLAAATRRAVRLELASGPPDEGRLLAYDEVSVTIALLSSGEVVTLPRTELARVLVVPTTGPRWDRRRMIGVAFGLPGTLVADVDYSYLHGFASANVLFPILTASGDSRWVGASVGGGLALPLAPSSRWKLDVFAQIVPLHVTSFYTYLGAGLGAGFHYTARSGFTVGFTFPIVGVSTRLGSSPYGYDAPYRYNDSIGYYYFGSLVGLPLVTMGYRFPASCP